MTLLQLSQKIEDAKKRGYTAGRASDGFFYVQSAKGRIMRTKSNIDATDAWGKYFSGKVRKV